MQGKPILGEVQKQNTLETWKRVGIGPNLDERMAVGGGTLHKEVAFQLSLKGGEDFAGPAGKEGASLVQGMTMNQKPTVGGQRTVRTIILPTVF